MLWFDEKVYLDYFYYGWMHCRSFEECGEKNPLSSVMILYRCTDFDRHYYDSTVHHHIGISRILQIHQIFFPARLYFKVSKHWIWSTYSLEVKSGNKFEWFDSNISTIFNSIDIFSNVLIYVFTDLYTDKQMSEVTTNISKVDTFCVSLFETNLLSEFKLFLKTYVFIYYIQAGSTVYT